MVKIQVRYEGTLRCSAEHGPSNRQLLTDAPVDNCGKGESFSPTDLVATALGTCMLTIMGIAANKHGLQIEGAVADVEKHMIADPARRIERLDVILRVPGDFDAAAREVLEQAALGCPVHQSIRAGIEIRTEFDWSAATRVSEQS